jgi:hypothetical protein
MGFPQGVLPASANLTTRRGTTLRRVVTVYEDEAKTKPLSLSGWTPELVIADGQQTYLALTSGSGLTVTAAKGEIAVLVTPAQTKNAPRETLHYYLTIEESASEKVEVLEGTLTISPE